MINYIYTITNKAGQSFKLNDFTTNPAKFFALQQYPDMEVDVKNSETDLQGQHGIWDFFSYFGKRNISFNGVIVGDNESDVEELRAEMLKVLQLPIQPTESNDGYVTISWVDARGDAWAFDAKISRSPKFSRNLRQQYKLDFLISFKTETPFILSADATTSTGMRGYFAYGFLLPVTLPATMGDVAYDPITILNDGTISAHTVVRLYGEDTAGVVNPTIKNITTGKLFKLNLTLADATKWVEIDSANGTVVDQDGVDRSSSIDPASEFILIAVGSNSVIYTGDNSVGTPAGDYSVIFKNTRI